MACSRPFHFKQQKSLRPQYSWNPLTQFPCGWCLNCRVDKRNALIHRCEKEYIDKKCGAFVTFTYDDPHIIHLLRRSRDGRLQATLSKYDAKKFLDRLNKLVHKMPNSILCNHKYKYLIVGEYGERGQVFDRPHFHCLFFGLDFAVCKKLFLQAWQGQGQIDIGYIGDGAISYVNKYLDKQIFGDLAKAKYDDNNLERPFCHRSTGLGSSLYTEQLDYANQPEHLGCYSWKGKDVPFPQYWKNKYLLRYNKSVQFKKAVEDYYAHNNRPPKSTYDLHEFKIHKSKIREENLRQKIFSSGSPALDSRFVEEVLRPDWHKKMWLSFQYNDRKKLVRQAANDIPF